MSKQLTISGTTYDYPTNREDPGWGEDATAWAEAVTNSINDLQGAFDISETSFTVADDQTTFQDITGFSFSPTDVRSFEANYNVYRSDGDTDLVEAGVISGVFNETSWDWDVSRIGDTGVEFNITNGGQVQYKSSAIGGSYTGVITFKAKTIIKD